MANPFLLIISTMKKYLIYAIAILFTSGSYAQGVYNNGAKITVGTGTYLVIGGTNGNLRNETNASNGSVDLAGTLALTGNVTNNVATGDVLGTTSAGSEILLNGTTLQNIGGTTTTEFLIPNLTVNNASGIHLAKNVQVSGNLSLTSGIMDVGNNDFTFGPLAVVLGVPSNTKMLIASGTGHVKKFWSATGAFTFPIGDNQVSAEYSPVTLTFNSGTFATGALTALNVVNTKYNDPFVLSSYLNRYWNLSQTGITAFNCDAVFQYLPTDVVGTESVIYTLKGSQGPFAVYSIANTALHQLSATGLTSLNTFTGGTTDYKTLNLASVQLEGLYNGSANMIQAHDNLGAHWQAGIADQITVELHDAVTYSNILYSSNVPLTTAGIASMATPTNLGSNYYITVKHRNSLETTTATAVSFASSTINQSFGQPTDVFGGHLKLMPNLSYAIFTGDVNQDGIINITDRAMLLTDLNAALLGYSISDINGDGAVNTSDRALVLSNLNAGVIKLVP